MMGEERTEKTWMERDKKNERDKKGRQKNKHK